MNALKTIRLAAGRLRKKHPGMSYKNALKKAGAEYRSKNKSGVPKKKRKKLARKQVSFVRVTNIRRTAKKGITVAGYISDLKGALLEKLGNALVAKERAKGKRAKRKAQKRITELRAKLKKAETL